MKKSFAFLAVAVALISSASFTACKKETRVTCYFEGMPDYETYRRSGSTALQAFGNVMGCDVIISLSDSDNFADRTVYDKAVSLWNEAQQVLIEANNSLSLTVSTSAISRFNSASAGSTVEIDKTAYEVLGLAKSLYAQTDGYFNPAVVQSSLLYGFSSGTVTPLTALPSQQTQQSFVELSSAFAEITLNEVNGTYYAVKPQKTVTVDGVTHSLQLDLGGIGKGWCADKINALIDNAGFKYGYFNFGSSTMAVKRYVSTQNDNNYTVGSRDPRGAIGTAYAKFPVKDSALSTSGDYEQYYTLNDVRYCHVIDPTTGAPVQTGVASVTVVGGTASEDDAYTTALMAMGKQRAVEFINANLSDRFVIMLVLEEGQGKIICNQPQKVEIVNESYAIANTVEEGKIILN